MAGRSVSSGLCHYAEGNGTAARLVRSEKQNVEIINVYVEIDKNKNGLFETWYVYM